MRKMRTLTLFFILAFGLVSCKEQAIDCGDPVSTECILVILDKNHVPLLGNKYPFDAISLKVGDKTIHLDYYNDELFFNFSGLEHYNNMDYLLKWDNEDCDTINMYVRKFQNDCWESFSIDTFRYNNKLIGLTLNRFEIIK